MSMNHDSVKRIVRKLVKFGFWVHCLSLYYYLTLGRNDNNGLVGCCSVVQRTLYPRHLKIDLCAPIIIWCNATPRTTPHQCFIQDKPHITIQRTQYASFPTNQPNLHFVHSLTWTSTPKSKTYHTSKTHSPHPSHPDLPP